MPEDKIEKVDNEEYKNREDMQDRIRICMLGGSGTGKSCFFSGLYQSLVGNRITIGSGADKISVSLKVTYMDKVNSFFSKNGGGAIRTAMYSAAEMQSEYSISRYGFPNSTADSRAFIFELRINNIPCCEVEIIDYTGEFLDSPEAHGDNINTLCNHLAESDALIIVADTIEVYKNLNIRSKLIDSLDTMNLNMMFTSIDDIVQQNNHRLSTLIALTKSDSPVIPDNIRANNFAGISDMLANDVFGMIIDQTRNSGGSTGVIPVSAIGDNNTNENNEIKKDANIQQKNIDVAVLFCIYNAVERKINRQDEYLGMLNADLKRMGIFRNREARNNLTQKISELTERRKMLSLIREILEQDPDYFYKNINELHMYGSSKVGETS